MFLKIKRLSAIGIDFGLIFFTMYTLAYLSSIIIPIKVIEKIIELICLILIYIFIIRKDILFGNESVGKKIMKLTINDKNNNQVKDKKLLLERNVKSFWSLPICLISLITKNRSTGDIEFNTNVNRLKT